MIIEPEERKWQREKARKEKRYKIWKEKQEFRKTHRLFNKPSTSKLLIFFLFINCTAIELFTGFITLKSFDLATLTLVMPDFTPLVTLIGAVVSEVIGFAVYSIKSAKENTVGGIVYEQAMAKLNNNCGCNDKEQAQG